MKNIFKCGLGGKGLHVSGIDNGKIGLKNLPIDI